MMAVEAKTKVDEESTILNSFREILSEFMNRRDSDNTKGWIETSKRLPPFGEKIIVTHNNIATRGTEIIFARLVRHEEGIAIGDGESCFEEEFRRFHEYWMYIPRPPV